MPDGNTASVRIDPAVMRNPPLGNADEVPHAHKEIVPTSNVTNGNYDHPNISKSIACDDKGDIAEKWNHKEKDIEIKNGVLKK